MKKITTIIALTLTMFATTIQGQSTVTFENANNGDTSFTVPFASGPVSFTILPPNGIPWVAGDMGIPNAVSDNTSFASFGIKSATLSQSFPDGNPGGIFKITTPAVGMHLTNIAIKLATAPSTTNISNFTIEAMFVDGTFSTEYVVNSAGMLATDVRTVNVSGFPAFSMPNVVGFRLKVVRIIPAQTSAVIHLDNVLYTKTVVVLGSEDFEKDSNVSIYPNPTSNVLNTDLEMLSEYSITASNMLGQQFNLNTFDKTIDTSNLSPGIYVLQLSSKNDMNTSKTVKFIKQ